MIVRSRIVVGGMFEPVAFELRTAGFVTIERSSPAHLFFTVRDDLVGLARPTDDGWAVEMLVTDRTGGVATSVLAGQLGALFQHYSISGPSESLWPTPRPASPS